MKVIPWGQVIEHAPVVLKGARRLMERQRDEVPPQPEATRARAEASNAPTEARLAQLEATLTELQARLDRVTEQQRQGDELLAALAEQNARLVAAVDVLQQRLRLLAGAVAVLAGGALLLAWQVFGH